MYERCIYFNLATLNRRVSKIWQDEFAILGLSPSHGYLLAAMAEQPMATQKQLSEIMELDASTITRFVDVLNAKKLIEKTRVGKGATFVLTVSGVQLTSKINVLMSKLFNSMQGSLGEDELSNFVDVLHKTKHTFENT